MNADLPRMERVPAEGPTYAMRLSAATHTMEVRRGAGARPDAVVVCVREGHGGKADPEVAELWSIGNEVLWRSNLPLPSGMADTKVLMDAAMDSVRKASEAHGIPKPKGLSILPTLVHTHLINEPPSNRVDCIEVEDIDAHGNRVMAWHTEAWPGGTEVLAYCPEHKIIAPDEAAILDALRRGERRVPLH